MGPGLCSMVTPAIDCVNMAKGGRSSGSYRAEGSWTQVMDRLRRNAEYPATYVLIQFGHNDQPGKPGRSTDLATEFPVNLRRFVDEVKGTGAIPVLLTPLTGGRSATARCTTRSRRGRRRRRRWRQRPGWRCWI